MGRKKNEVGFPSISGVKISEVQPGTTIKTAKITIGHEENETIFGKLARATKVVIEIWGQIIERK